MAVGLSRYRRIYNWISNGKRARFRRSTSARSRLGDPPPAAPFARAVPRVRTRAARPRTLHRIAAADAAKILEHRAGLFQPLPPPRPRASRRGGLGTPGATRKPTQSRVRNVRLPPRRALSAASAVARRRVVNPRHARRELRRRRVRPPRLLSRNARTACGAAGRPARTGGSGTLKPRGTQGGPGRLLL